MVAAYTDGFLQKGTMRLKKSMEKMRLRMRLD